MTTRGCRDRRRFARGSFDASGDEADFSDRKDISFDDPKLSTSRPVNERMLSDERRRRLASALADGTDASAFLCMSTRVVSTLTSLPPRLTTRTDVPASHSAKDTSSTSSPHILASDMDETRERAMRCDVGVRGG